MPAFLPYGLALALSLSVPDLDDVRSTNAVVTATVEPTISKTRTEYILGMRMVSFSRSSLPKWQEVAERHERQVEANGDYWGRLVSHFREADATKLLQRVNREVNRARYVTDAANWRTRDHWATPQELLERGGDCEDYAIAKYLILRKVGVSPSDMHIAVSKSHAVLIVTTAGGPVVLDSARPEIRPLEARFAKKIVFVANEQSWAINVGPDGFQLVSR